MRFEPVQIVTVRGQKVRLVRCDNHGAGREVWRILTKFFVDLFKIIDRITLLAAGDIDNVDEQAAAVDMAQEIVAKANAVSCTLNNAGDIGHDKRNTVGNVDHAEVRIECGKVVICNFGVRVGRNGQEC